jgi:hypothetical protein
MSFLGFLFVKILGDNEFADFHDWAVTDDKRPALPAVPSKTRPLLDQNAGGPFRQLVLRIRHPQKPFVIVGDNPIDRIRKPRLPFIHSTSTLFFIV